jgi:uncharacterized protein YegP (UPF0339 family)
VEASVSRPDKTIVFQDKAGGWRWKRVAPNGEIIATSGESYTRLSDAERAASRAFLAPDGADDEAGDEAP